MRAVLRFGIAAFAAGVALGPLPALAQVVPQSTTNTPAADTVGPRELQNFSLNGTVTRTAEAPPPAPPARSTARPPSAAPDAGASGATADPSRASPAPRRQAAAEPTPAPRRDESRALALDISPAAPSTTASLPAGVAQPGFLPDAAPAPVVTDSRLVLWPWLLLAAVLGAGAAFLFLRRRSREAFAGGPEIDAFVAPEPMPAPRQAPPPVAPKAAPPPAKPVGIVSTRLRPWLDVAFVPVGCLVDDERVAIEFELQLTNSGGAPARDVLVEASLFNAGATQEQDIGAFFANPIGQGERIDGIAPLQSMTIRNSLIAPRQNIQLFELGGRQVFVPLVAFNVLYRQTAGSAQTSAAYMLGRETGSDKLGPLRADLGAKAFTKLGTRLLPVAVRS